MLKFLLLMGLSVCLLSCAHKSPGVSQLKESDFSKYGKIAVIKFDSVEFPVSGQEAANLLSLAFMQKGYRVIDASNVLASADQEKLYTGVLTRDINTKFNNQGVDTIVLGAIHDYSCETVANWLLSLFQIDAYRTYCRVSVTVKMVKLDSGEILWGVSRSEEEAGSDIDAGDVLRDVIHSLEDEIPADTTKQPAEQ